MRSAEKKVGETGNRRVGAASSLSARIRTEFKHDVIPLSSFRGATATEAIEWGSFLRMNFSLMMVVIHVLMPVPSGGPCRG
jgi:hypothetical protein